MENTKYYLRAGIPRIKNQLMRSGPLSLQDAYNGYLGLRSRGFRPEEVVIKQRRGKNTRGISFEELSKRVEDSGQKDL